ncbi:HAAS signaling domain-containing protein [Heyndrickxia ginsengihumi]|uniref:DUF1700 domain-containing protein n=1 Tax=Heyndrickxia ginsengihumi TaxID=363870 RepID=A0A0A6Y3J1_9BACI|nr:DUF1700 domain-containing protein [Heyndrickxia ginsengihumi]KHD86797.1 hypothetical protein NG54_01705 [Heyndrickxia ginsengihumi]MBE6183312.1 DUF1700 domain-containing protein [Bacillus sp. (in: firmicutes)]MCM3022273.1 DUF1700 domain-containing protein [Heyndrickxia ginsengihumi]NEY18507.1 DUF1700 domain-containing protein [Heyndrickxia ginsengihumi]
MGKEQFLKQLKSSLRKLSTEEREDILHDYEEHFTIGLSEGKTEEEIANSLGSPQQIAKEMLALYHMEKVETTVTPGNILRAVWAVIGLGFFNLVIVLGPFIALVGVLFAGWAASISFVVSPLIELVQGVLYPKAFNLFELFISLAICGVGLLVIVAMFYITKGLIYLFLRYLKYNISLVKGGLKHD